MQNKGELECYIVSQYTQLIELITKPENVDELDVK